MVSMETDLFRGLGVARHWGKKGKHIVKSGSTSVVQLDQLSLLGREMGKQGHAPTPRGQATSLHPIGFSLGDHLHDLLVQLPSFW